MIGQSLNDKASPELVAEAGLSPLLCACTVKVALERISEARRAAKVAA